MVARSIRLRVIEELLIVKSGMKRTIGELLNHSANGVFYSWRQFFQVVIFSKETYLVEQIGVFSGDADNHNESVPADRRPAVDLFPDSYAKIKQVSFIFFTNFHLLQDFKQLALVTVFL